MLVVIVSTKQPNRTPKKIGKKIWGLETKFRVLLTSEQVAELVSFRLRALYSRENTPKIKKAGRTSEIVWPRWRSEKSLPTSGIEPSWYGHSWSLHWHYTGSRTVRPMRDDNLLSTKWCFTQRVATLSHIAVSSVETCQNVGHAFQPVIGPVLLTHSTMKAPPVSLDSNSKTDCGTSLSRHEVKTGQKICPLRCCPESCCFHRFQNVALIQFINNLSKYMTILKWKM